MAEFLMIDGEDRIVGSGAHSSALLAGALEKARRDKSGLLILSSESLSFRDPIGELIGHYGASVYLDHHSYAELENPNDFSYRFLDTCVKGIPIFEFFDSNDPFDRKSKNDSRSVFENSVFLFHFGMTGKAYAGFRNLENLYPYDRAVSLYRERCEKLLYSE